MRIYNGMLTDCVVVNGKEYTINTYIANGYHYWCQPWVSWIIYDGTVLHETKITKHTLEAAEATHRYVVEHAEEILKEREKRNGLDY